MQDVTDPRHFLSFSEWTDANSRDTWKASPEFAEGFASCRELCEDFRGGEFSQLLAFHERVVLP
jgi:heme-degrading monooxygenase HmoA